MHAYHGTNLTAARSILKQGFYLKTYNVKQKSKQKMPGDLGAGIYAFVCKDKISNSLNYAKKRFGDNHCTLMLTLKKNPIILDLEDPKNIEYINRFRKNLNLVDIEERAMNDLGKRDVTLDGYVIEHVIANLEERNPKKKIAVVRSPSYTKFETGINFHASKIPNGVEICIRQRDVILDIVKENKYKKTTVLRGNYNEN